MLHDNITEPIAQDVGSGVPIDETLKKHAVEGISRVIAQVGLTEGPSQSKAVTVRGPSHAS